MNKKIYAILLTSFSLLHAQEQTSQNQTDAWFTGPILTPSASVLSPGQWNFQPYVFVYKYYGNFDQNGKTQKLETPYYRANFQYNFQVGLCPFVQLNAFTQQYQSWEKNPAGAATKYTSSTNWGDSSLGLKFAILQEDPSYSPAVSVGLTGTFPTGKCNNLDTEKKGLDGTGNGAYHLGINLNISKTFNTDSNFPVRLHLAQTWGLPTTAKLEKVNAYGGDDKTSGKMHLKHSYSALFGIEALVTKQFGLTTDVGFHAKQKGEYTANNPSDAGKLPEAPASYALHLSHGLQFNVTKDFGVVGGVDYAVLGKNASKFFGGTISFTYTF